jgi:N-acetyl-gamma-glutamyl-phosphate reductase
LTNVSVLGATGYTGRELLALLARHPHAALTHATTTTRAGMSLAEVHPSLRGVLDGRLEAFDAAAVAADSQVVFSCLPHKESMHAVNALLEANPRLKVVDLSGDFRFHSAADYEATYGVPHVAPGLLTRTAYGVPELHRDAILTSQIVANAGCYPTSALLALAPLARRGLLEGEVLVDAKSGVSGAGATPTPTTHFAEANESVKPYNALVHRHQPEMNEQLHAIAGEGLELLFVPHLVPMTRGLLSTIWCTLREAHTAADVQAVLEEDYTREPFVRVLPPGQLPDTKHSVGTNFADVGFALHANGRRLVIACALDNLVKGASGQALQNFNLLAGHAETAGLLPNPPMAKKVVLE